MSYTRDGCHACKCACYEYSSKHNVCKQCGGPMGIHTPIGTIYCGGACRQKAYRERKKVRDAES